MGSDPAKGLYKIYMRDVAFRKNMLSNTGIS
jgi:hypothetical protein